MEVFASLSVKPFIRVGTEIVALRLQKIGGQPLTSQPVKIGQGGGQTGYGDSVRCCSGDDAPEIALCTVYRFGKIVIKKKMLERRLILIGRCNPVKKCRTDDTSASPDLGYKRRVEMPIIVF